MSQPDRAPETDFGPEVKAPGYPSLGLDDSYYQRQDALAQAIEHHKRGFDPAPVEVVVATARAFYEFMTGLARAEQPPLAD